MINACYCVCLDKRKSLWGELEKQVNNIAGLPLNKFIVGSGNDHELSYNFVDYPYSSDMWNYCRYGTRDTIASHANCFLSHKEVINIAKRDNLSNILLLEDDCHLIKDRWDTIINSDKIQDFIKYNKFDLLYLGWWLKETDDDTEDQQQAELSWETKRTWDIKVVPRPPEVAHNICGLHGLLVNNSAFDFLINAEYGPMDSYLGSNLDKLRAYYITPKVIHVNSQFSYGENSYVKRNVLV